MEKPIKKDDLGVSLFLETPNMFAKVKNFGELWKSCVSPPPWGKNIGNPRAKVTFSWMPDKNHSIWEPLTPPSWFWLLLLFHVPESSQQVMLRMKLGGSMKPTLNTWHKFMVLHFKGSNGRHQQSLGFLIYWGNWLLVSTHLKNISQNGNLPQFSGWK